MSTLAQQQADTLDDSVKRIVVAQQFAEDWLDVIENDNDSYQYLMEATRNAEGVAQLSQILQDEWGNLISDIADDVEERFSELASLLIRNTLLGYGQIPFDIIARKKLDDLRQEMNN